ncbi:MAG: phage major capsid protein [Phycisphaerales bacterium]|nr:phage major capsid protein [Phycisphaerales bacterium]
MFRSSTPPPTSAREQQEAGLVRELLAAVDTRFSALDRRVQQQFAEHAREISRMHDSMNDHQASSRDRFKTLLGEFRSGRARIDDAEVMRAFGRLIRSMAEHRESSLPLGGGEGGSNRQASGGAAQTAGIHGGTGAQGGLLVGERVLGGILDNLERSSVFERNATIFNVTGHGGVPRITQGAQVFYPDYEVDVTEGEVRFASAKFNPTRYAALAMIDRWMLSSAEDIMLGQFLINELSRALAYATDSNAFIGNGSPAYARVNGLFNRENAGMVVTADTGDASYQAVADATTKYLAKVCGAIPEVTEQYEPKFYMHRSIWFSYLGARDGTDRPIADFFAGGEKQLWGYPVETVAMLPKLADASQASKPMLAFGALRRGWAGARQGDQFELRISEHVAFKAGQIAFLMDAPQDLFQLDPNVMVLLKTAAS